jgi:EamA-like transporter family
MTDLFLLRHTGEGARRVGRGKPQSRRFLISDRLISNISAGLDRLGVSRVMVYMSLIPVAGVGLSAAFFGDPLTAARVLGGLIVLLAVIMARVALDRAARVPV